MYVQATRVPPLWITNKHSADTVTLSSPSPPTHPHSTSTCVANLNSADCQLLPLVEIIITFISVFFVLLTVHHLWKKKLQRNLKRTAGTVENSSPTFWRPTKQEKHTVKMHGVCVCACTMLKNSYEKVSNVAFSFYQLSYIKKACSFLNLSK